MQQSLISDRTVQLIDNVRATAELQGIIRIDASGQFFYANNQSGYTPVTVAAHPQSDLPQAFCFDPWFLTAAPNHPSRNVQWLRPGVFSVL